MHIVCKADCLCTMENNQLEVTYLFTTEEGMKSGN